MSYRMSIYDKFQKIVLSRRSLFSVKKGWFSGDLSTAPLPAAHENLLEYIIFYALSHM
jgi:hypothetical protein